jgi:hypothetical protein
VVQVPDDIRDELDELDPIEVTRLLGVQRPAVDPPPGALDPDAIERRATLAAALVPAMFPVRTNEVVAVLAGADVPDDLRSAIRDLPDQSFANVQELWVALGGPVEVREPTVELEDTGPERATASAVAKSVLAVRGLASFPIAASGSACTLGAAVLERASEGLTSLASRVSGLRG